MIESRFGALNNELQQEVFAKENSVNSFTTELEKVVNELS